MSKDKSVAVETAPAIRPPRGATLGAMAGLLFGGAEVFCSSLFAEIHAYTHIFIVCLYVLAGSLGGAALDLALRFGERGLAKLNIKSDDRALCVSVFLAVYIFLYGLYYLNEKALSGIGIFALPSLIADLFFFLLCCGLAAFFYRFNRRRDFDSSLFFGFASVAFLPIILLVGATYHFFAWAALRVELWSIAGSMLVFVMLPMLGFLLEHALWKLFSSRLRHSLSGMLLRMLILVPLGGGGIALLGPPRIDGHEVARPPLSESQRAFLKGKPNIIWIVADTARRDRFSLYGYHRQTTPNIDAFAKDAVVFTRAIAAAPWTVPSHASMFTGMYPSKHGAHHSGRRSICDPLPQANLTIAEILSGVGYSTACIAANNAGLSRGFALDQGFQLYFADLPSVYSLLWGKLLQQLPGKIKNDYLRINDLSLASEINPIVVEKVILSWVKKHHADPFFLFVNYMEPHGGINHIPQPYDSLFGFRRDLHDKIFEGFDQAKIVRKEKTVTEEQKAFHDAYTDRKIAFMDHHLGRLLDTFKEVGIYDGAMIIITSDHGNLFGEHFSFGHNTDLYNELIWVPLIVKYPRSMQRSGTEDKYVSNIDVMPEILSVAGLPVPEGVQGQPFAEVSHEIIAELFEQKNNAHARMNPQRYYRDLRAIYSNDAGNLKYIYSSNGDGELFDLDADPAEIKNLAETMPDKVKALEARLESRLNSFEPVRDEDAREITSTDKLMERLRALGYVK